MKRRSFLASGLAAAAFAPQAARAQLRPFQQQLTIGINAPLSGSAQVAGQQMANAVQIAINYVNQFTPNPTSAFTMRLFDTAGDDAQAVNNIQFAASDPTVLALIAGFDGAGIAQALPAYANAQMPVLVPATTADAITNRGYRVVWRLPTKDSTEGQLFARFIAERTKPKLAIAVSQSGLYGGDVMDGFTNQAHSLKFASDGYVFPSDSPDYKAAAERIIARSPDFVLLCGQTNGLGPLIPALRVAGYKGSFGASEGFYNTTTAQRFRAEFKDGFISSSFPPLEHLPNTTMALADFRSRTSISIVSAFSYAAAQIVIAAVRRTNATNRLATMTALQTPSTYNTIVGPFLFAPTGDPVDPNLYFYATSKDGFRFVAPSHASAFVL